MTGSPTPGARFAVVCPHCKKTFEAELLTGASDRYRGFKCPHCRLFVAYKRADDASFAGAAD